MNNPFDLYQNKDAQTEQESHRLKIRVTVLLSLFGAILLVFAGVLYSVQVVHGEEYLDNTSYTIVENENVETVRGSILDSSGRVLVGNEQVYNIVLDLDLMGEQRNRILLELLELCREYGVEWSDSLPISDTAPWLYTKHIDSVFSYTVTGDDGTVTRSPTLLGTLAKRLKWIDKPESANLRAGNLLSAMCLTFGLTESKDEPITEELRDAAGVLYDLYLRKYELTYSSYVFARDVDISFITKVKEHNLSGVEIRSTTTRRYTTDNAAHILGPVALISPDDWPIYKELGYPMNSYVGKGGVELAFENWLHGSDGVRRTETDEYGNIISESWAVEPQPGNNVVLTIDATVQDTTEQLLAQFVNSLEEPAGAAAVMLDVNTGGVISMASYPTYDLSTYSQNYSELLAAEHNPLYNRATHGLYAPGSTFKPLTAIAALTEKIVTPSSTVYCGGIYEYYAYAGYTPVCWIHTMFRSRHGDEAVSKAITDSCNIYFYDVGRRLGIQSLVEYATMFGLGQKTGIEIGEYQGMVAGPESAAALGLEWYGGDTLPAAIGQGNHQFTPIQLANYIATLVNGGSHYEVHLLDSVKSADFSSTVYQYEPVARNTIDISPTALAAVKKGMYDLSKTSSMRSYFAGLPVEVGCKTGTAEVAGSDIANAVFVCFAPYDNPEVALCIVAEKGDSGGSLASVAAGMLAQYFASQEGQNTTGAENTLIP